MNMTKRRHRHQWGEWIYGNHWNGNRVMRFCISGFCEVGQFRNGHRFMARPERKRARAT